MIWWRGNGLWIGLLVVLPALSAGALGPSMVAAAYACSAVFIFVMRNTIGTQSALYSIPTNFWPPILIVLALLIQFSPGRASRGATNSGPQGVATGLQASMPRMLNKQVRLEKAEFDSANNTVQIFGSAPATFAEDAGQQAALRRDARKLYCDNAKGLVQSKAAMAFTVTIPPRTLNEKVERQTFAIQPQECAA